MARGYVETHGGGELLSVLVADTLEELRAMLPAGFARRERVAVCGLGVVEAWN